MKLSFPAALALLATAGTAAAAPAGQCLTPAELDAVTRATLPEVAGTVIARCRPSLPATSYLARRGDALVARLRPQAEAALPTAGAALARSFGQPALANLKPETMRDLVTAGLTSELNRLRPSDCGAVDRGMALLDPLPPANLAGAVAFVLTEAGRGNRGRGNPFRLCPTPAR